MLAKSSHLDREIDKASLLLTISSDVKRNIGSINLNGKKKEKKKEQNVRTVPIDDPIGNNN